MALDRGGKTATLYRMVMPDRLCPYGLKSKDLLERQGFSVEDHHLKTREETDAFQREHDVDDPADIHRWRADRRLRRPSRALRAGGQGRGRDQLPARPAIFSTAFLIALVVSWYAFGTVLTVRAFEWFIAISMTLLAVQKLQDIESFSTMFLNYDLLARRWVRYGYLYPFGEALAGILIIAGALIWLATPIALFIGTWGRSRSSRRSMSTNAR